ncbi:MAG: ABC transporter substrate-binding protein [Desulfuromonadales bacterium]|nr:ABC transporter substrate-binding protein [Desulfuromonadales bacterium]
MAQRRITWITIKLLLYLLALSLLTHCDKTPPLEKVALQLQWVHQGEFAWAYLAKEEGVFAEQGLDTTLVPGGPGIDQVEELLAGRAQFITLPAEALLKARQAGKPLLAIVTLYQRNPTTFISLKDSGITKPEDFVGKRGTFSTPAARAQLFAMLGKLGISDPQISEQPYNYNYAGLLDGSIDFSDAYAVGGVLRLSSAGAVLNVIWPRDYGIHFYGPTLVTTEEFSRAHPDLTQRFVNATLKGLEQTLANPKLALAATMNYAKEQDRKLQAAMIKISLPLIAPEDDYLGKIRGETLQEMNEILYEQKILSRPDLWKKAFNRNYFSKTE